MKRLGLILSVVVLALFWLTHDSVAEPYQHPATALLFPDRLAAMEKGEVTDFEKENPGLGVSVGYNAPGMTVTIYVYTMGMKSVPSDLKSPVLRGHFAQVVEDVIRFGKMGRYGDVKKTSEGEVFLNASDAAPKALSATFSYFQNGRERLSNLYLIGYKNHFLKVRFTYDQDARSKAEETLKQLLGELATMIR